MCIFCKIVSGEIPSYKVYEDDNFLAFLDISQATYGHTLVIPKKHYANLLEMPNELLSKMFIIVKNISEKLTKATQCEGFNILNNNGEAAGQTIHHFHVHIIPRYSNDNLEIKFYDNKLTPDQFNDLVNKIK